MSNQNETNPLQIIPTLPLGAPVTYVGTKGHPKLALVVGTPESVAPGTSLPELSEGQLHLAVWTVTAGTFLPRFNVPFEGQVADNTEFQNEDGASVGFWRL